MIDRTFEGSKGIEK
jgi:hypothetical protein